MHHVDPRCLENIIKTEREAQGRSELNKSCRESAPSSSSLIRGSRHKHHGSPLGRNDASGIGGLG